MIQGRDDHTRLADDGEQDAPTVSRAVDTQDYQ